MFIKKRIFLMMCIIGILFLFSIVIPLVNATKQEKQICIYIDPGHGGYDGGCTSKDSKVLEKDVTLNVSLLLASYLRQTGYVVKLTREADVALNDVKREDIYKRVKMINESKANLYISIHANAYPSSIVKGAQVFYQGTLDENKKIAECIMKELKTLDTNNKREILTIKDKYLVDNVKIPGCLVEIGFLSNNDELQKLTNTSYQASLALTLYMGIMEYLDYVK